MKKLLFVRHGLTAMNSEGLFSGQIETPLTEEGKEQAKQAGKNLKRDYSVDLIISSSLSRAFDTASIIATELDYPVDKIQKSGLIIERGFGLLEATPFEEFFEEHIYKDLDDVEGAETIEELHDRAHEALEFIKSLKQDNILVVSHGAFGRAFRRAVKGEPHTHEYTNPFAQIKNAEIVVLI